MAEKRILCVLSHPIQYYTPLLRALAEQAEVEIAYLCGATPDDQSDAGFGRAFDWDVDLSVDAPVHWVKNTAKSPSPSRFFGSKNPEIKHLIREGKFDAVIVFGWYLVGFIQCIIACRQLGVPVIVRGDSHLNTGRSLFRTIAQSMLYPMFMRLFDRFCYVGDENYRFYRKFGVSDNKLFFSPHCVDNDRFSASRCAESAKQAPAEQSNFEKEFIIGYVGKLIPLKNVHHLIAATERMVERGLDIRLKIIGSGPDEESLREASRQIFDRVDFLGFVNQEGLPCEYRKLDVLVLPSESETWGLVCNEALAAGTPVICSDRVGAAKDLAIPEVSGAIFPVGEVNELVIALMAVMKRGRANFDTESIITKYSPQRAAEGILNACASIH